MNLRNGKNTTQPQIKYTEEDMVVLFNDDLRLKKFKKVFKKIKDNYKNNKNKTQPKQLSIYDKWRIDGEINGRL